LALAVTATSALMASGSATPSKPPPSHTISDYDHIFLVVGAPTDYSSIVGNPAASDLNVLADAYGSATAYSALAPLFEPRDRPAGERGGTRVAERLACDGSPTGLMRRLQAAGLKARVYEADAFPFAQFAQDLASPPNFACILAQFDPPLIDGPQGAPEPAAGASEWDGRLRRMDAFIGKVAKDIISAPFWTRGNNAVVITFDSPEPSDGAGHRGAEPVGGRVATFVLTSRGPRRLEDPTPYNPLSLLKTIEEAFDLGCRDLTCDSKAVRSMSPLF
jgi:hypothetical protein